MVHLIEDEILERSSQERTELTLDRAHLAQRFVVEKMQKKTLRQILCFVCIETPAPDKEVDRLPIDPADLRKRILGTRRLALRRQEDRAPTGGAKSSSAVCWRWRLWLQSDLFRFLKLPDTSRLLKQILHVAARIKSDPNATFPRKAETSRRHYRFSS